MGSNSPSAPAACAKLRAMSKKRNCTGPVPRVSYSPLFARSISATRKRFHGMPSSSFASIVPAQRCRSSALTMNSPRTPEVPVDIPTVTSRTVGLKSRLASACSATANASASDTPTVLIESNCAIHCALSITGHSLKGRSTSGA